MMSQFAQDIEKTVRQKALREGEARGEARGEAKLLLRMLPQRFGPLPDEISEQIHRADSSTIENWADRVLNAKSLEEVFSE
uniref:DUF4351 domain-containing protein n=1 Tax=Candidatus Kentrum sp. UNK TaxID=2126344 RepID=A0A451AJY3_9GAMM|nr:MAG: protein of unknown function (DUF4351) [Candidatus Kentron sp. UNK]VFK71958.1 MAG: protein of unknown function (DUF4351) [Candidatus Kentron sp. UNK]